MEKANTKFVLGSANRGLNYKNQQHIFKTMF